MTQAYRCCPQLCEPRYLDAGTIWAEERIKKYEFPKTYCILDSKLNAGIVHDFSDAVTLERHRIFAYTGRAASRTAGKER